MSLEENSNSADSSVSNKIQQNTANMSAMLLSGAISIFLSEWDFILYGFNLSQLKPVAFAALPAFALSISYAVRKLWLMRKIGASQRGILSESEKAIDRIKKRLEDQSLPDSVKKMLEDELLTAIKDDITLSKTSITTLKKNQDNVINDLDDKPPNTN
ncbi:hypothetical protein [Proteus mirabilis]|uniref:hypothetical protein n=1 Tax=Proteus mirabilis TaxID=584 RepID=UPI0034D5DADE